MTASKIFKIYCIFDPSKDNQVIVDKISGMTVKGEPKYVGRTIQSIDKHLKDHLRWAKNGGTWLIHTGLRELNCDVKVCLLETVKQGQSYQEAEQKWVKYFKDQGFKLWNRNKGGGGATGQGRSDDDPKTMVNGHVTNDQRSFIETMAKRKNISRAAMLRIVLDAGIKSLQNERP